MKDKITRISEHKHFKNIEEDLEEIRDLIKQGKMKNLLIAFQFEEDNLLQIGYKWSGEDSLTKILGIIEYIKSFIFEDSLSEE